jgi:hypothetical protein
MQIESTAQARTGCGFRGRRRDSLVALVCALLAACSAPRGDVPRGKELQLAVVMPADFGDGIQVNRKSTGKSAAKGAGGGAAGGAVGGAMVAAACGPWFLVCAPAFILVGAVGGGIGGAAVVGGATAAGHWPVERFEQLQTRLTRFQQAHDPVATLQSSLLGRANAHWKIGANPSATSVRVEWQNLGLHTGSGQQAALIASISLKVETPEDRQRGTTTLLKQLDYRGPFLHSRVWIEAPDDVFTAKFLAAYANLTDQVLAELGGY